MENEINNTSAQKNNISNNATIIIVAFLIVIALIVLKMPKNNPTNTQNADTNKPSKTNVNLSPITSTDHIRGDINAPVVIVEYSDTECPFCKAFHNTMKQILAQYNGKVAWVYRHMPLDCQEGTKLNCQVVHNRARNEALATECASDQGGDAMFWKYLDEVFNRTTSNDTLDPAQLPAIASFLGLDMNKFNTCMSTKKYADKIKNDEQSGENAGGEGTPYSVIVIKKTNQTLPLFGNQPIKNITSFLDTVIK